MAPAACRLSPAVGSYSYGGVARQVLRGRWRGVATTTIAIVVSAAALLGPSAGPARAGAVLVGIHPQASLQTTAVGKALFTLQSWNGKLYSGFGDYGANTGPIPLTPFDGNAFAAAPELNADTEAVWTFRVIDGKLYVPSIDPRSSSDFAVGTSVGGGANWSNPTVVGAAHVFDVVSLTGSDLWLVGAAWDGTAAAWRSLDGGATWQPPFSVAPVSGVAGDFARFYGAAVYQGKLYLQAQDFYGAVHPTSKVFDGTSWSEGPSLGLFNHADVFAGKLLYHAGNHAGWSAAYLKAFDGVRPKTVLSSPIYDYEIDGETVYTLRSDGQVMKSHDLMTWTPVTEAPAQARSIAIFNGSAYVGGTDARLYKLTQDPPSLTQHPLSVSKAGDGSGTVMSSPSGIDCGLDCTEQYDEGTTVTLTAVPESRSSFAGWSGPCSGTDPCVVNMNSAHTVTATFAAVQSPSPPPSGNTSAPSPSPPPSGDTSADETTAPTTLTPPLISPLVDEPAPQLRISRRPIRTRRGQARVRLYCAAGELGGCRGLVSIVKPVGRRTRSLGQTRFSRFAGGRSKVVRVRVTPVARRLLRRSKRITVQVRVRVRDDSGNTHSVSGRRWMTSR